MRAVWQQEHVVDVRDAAFSVRTYREQQDVRALLSWALGGRRPGAACEVGAGYGRMTVVLTEFFDRVEGFERELHFVEEAGRLLPAIRFHQVDSLTSLPAAGGSFDCVLTFTVLQHLTDAVALSAAREISRILRPGGVLLICEETDPAHRDGAVDDEAGMCTIGRTIGQYEALFSGFTLLQTNPRRIEPTYPRQDVGTYMLFARRTTDGRGRR
jgi:SAM-dependent methyltransferase